jgi:DNA-binding CsgD family transcriptional regulator
MYLSDRSVENHRYRIRKKLGLTTQQSLPDFLAKY